jgi:hypothetical protein
MRWRLRIEHTVFDWTTGAWVSTPTDRVFASDGDALDAYGPCVRDFLTACPIPTSGRRALTVLIQQWIGADAWRTTQTIRHDITA